MNIIHISDLHFGEHHESVYLKSDLKKALTNLIEEVGKEDFVLVISGDITFKGSSNGFRAAKDFFNDIITDRSLDRKRILVCPGNHDIIKNEPQRFKTLNEFIYFLRKDNILDFRNKNFVSCILDDVFFLLINTSYHLDWEYGLVDEEIYSYIEDNKNRIDNCRYKIAITHHHFLNQFKNDISAIRNSYPMLYALDTAEFNLILHGHQHAAQTMPIGKSRMQILSARSFNYPQKGYPNGVNHYLIRDRELIKQNIYEFSRDETPTKLKLVKR